ncbi:MAG: fibronectin type III domain-containing protein [bacterium]|nr:fibronectin type III domain-containing protein [bacterium]
MRLRTLASRILLVPLLVTVSFGSSFAVPVLALQFGGGQGAITVQDVTGLPSPQFTNTGRANGVVTLHEELSRATNFEGQFGSVTDISSALGAPGIGEYDVYADRLAAGGAGRIWIAFATTSNENVRLGISYWTAAGGWQGPGGGKYTLVERDGDNELLEDVVNVKVRANVGGGAAVFFEDSSLGDIYAVFPSTQQVGTPVNISNNPSLSSDFSVNEDGDVVVWLDNQTNAAFGGDVFLSTRSVVGGNVSFGQPRNLTQGLANRGDLEFSQPRLAGNASHSRLYVLARPPNSNTGGVATVNVTDDANPALIIGAQIPLSGAKLTAVKGGQLGSSFPASNDSYLVIAEDQDGVTLYHNYDDFAPARINGAHGAAALFHVDGPVDNGLGTLIYHKEGAVFLQPMRMNTDRGSVGFATNAPLSQAVEGTALRIEGMAAADAGYFRFKKADNSTAIMRVAIVDNRVFVDEIITRSLPAEAGLLGNQWRGVTMRNDTVNKEYIFWTSIGLQGMQYLRNVLDGQQRYPASGTFVSGKINSGPETVRRIELVATQNVSASRRIEYHVSNDGGATWNAPVAADFGIPGGGIRGMQYDFQGQGNDLRVKATLSTDDPLATPEIQNLLAAYYKVQQNQAPTVTITRSRQLPGTTQALIEYTASDPDGGRGRLTAEWRDAGGVWHAMGYVDGQTNDPQSLPLRPQPNNFQFMWDEQVGLVERPMPYRFQVSDGSVVSAYAEGLIDVDTQPPLISDFRAGAAAPTTIALQWDHPLDLHFDYYSTFYLRLPFPALDGRQLTCENVAQEPFTSLAVQQARPRSIRNIGNVTSTTLAGLFSDTCYVVFLEAHDTFGNTSVSAPLIARTTRPPQPQPPQIGGMSTQQETDGLVDIDYTITDSDSRSFTVDGTVAFIDSAGHAQTIPLVGDSLNRHGHGGRSVSFPDDQPGNSRQFRFVWDARSELLRYAITDATAVDIVFRVTDSEGAVGVGPQQRITVDGLAPRLNPVAADRQTTDGARVRWTPAEDANFTQYKLWLGNTEAAARFHPDQFVALLAIINDRQLSEYTFRGRRAGRTYYFCLEAFDRAGNQSASQCGEFSTTGVVVNHAPRLTSGAIGQMADNDLSFSVLVSDPEGDRVHLLVDYSTDQQNWRPASSADRSAFFDGYAQHALHWNYDQDLPNHNGDAWLRIVAEDGGGLRSAPLVLGPAAIAQRPPQWAGDLTLSNITTSGANVVWQAAQSNALIGYIVRAFNQATSEMSFNVFTEGTSQTLSNLASGTQYMAEVVAVDAAGQQVGKTKLFTTLAARTPITGPSITINNGAAETATNAVTLALHAAGADEMAIAHTGSFANVAWQPFAESVRWELSIPGRSALRSVYAKFRNASGTVTGTVSDRINYKPPKENVDVGVKVGDNDTLNVGITHNQKPYYGPDSTVILTAEALGNLEYTLIQQFVDGRFMGSCGPTNDRRCMNEFGPFEPGRHTYWAVIIPKGGAQGDGIRSAAGEFVIESEPLAATLSFDPADVRVGQAVTANIRVSGAAGKTVQVVLYDNNAVVGQCDDVGLREDSAGGANCSLSLTIQSAGPHVIRVAISIQGVEMKGLFRELDVRLAGGLVSTDDEPQGFVLNIAPDAVVTVGDQVTITGRVLGDNIRLDHVDLYEGPVGASVKVQTCQTAQCSYGYRTNVVGTREYYMTVSYTVGGVAREQVSDPDIYRVESREEALEPILDEDQFDVENNVDENDGAESADDVIVTNDNVIIIESNGQNLCEMRFSLDPIFEGAPWQEYDASAEFTLPPGEGESIVYTQYKSCDGEFSDVYVRRVILTSAQLAVASQSPPGQSGSPAGSADATSAAVIATFSQCLANNTCDYKLAERMLGRIIIAVERKGEAFYCYKKSSADVRSIRCYYLGRPTHAFSVMRFLGAGMATRDVARLFTNFVTPKPGDRAVFPTKDKTLLRRFVGQIILQVEQNGEAYYLSPIDSKGYYLGRPLDAFRVMRELGLGISNANLAKMPLFAEILKGKL